MMFPTLVRSFKSRMTMDRPRYVAQSLSPHPPPTRNRLPDLSPAMTAPEVSMGCGQRFCEPPRRLPDLEDLCFSHVAIPRLEASDPLGQGRVITALQFLFDRRLCENARPALVDSLFDCFDGYRGSRTALCMEDPAASKDTVSSRSARHRCNSGESRRLALASALRQAAPKVSMPTAMAKASSAISGPTATSRRLIPSATASGQRTALMTARHLACEGSPQSRNRSPLQASQPRARRAGSGAGISPPPLLHRLLRLLGRSSPSPR